MLIRGFIWHCLVFLLFFSAPFSVLADVYVYTDKSGVMNFTNTPTHVGYRRVLRDPNNPVRSASGLNTSYDSLIRTASGRYSVDPDLVRAVIKTESDFNPAARSHKGAMGLMQLMPDTARLHNVLDAYNPDENVEAGVRHLRMLLDRYRGNVELSLAAYNAGSGAVEKQGCIPPYVETREYVARVLHFYDRYRGEGLRLINAAHR